MLLTAPERESPPTYGKKILLTMGPPPSGKTSYIEKEHPDLFRVSMEEHGMGFTDLGDDYHESRKLVEFRHFLTIYLNRNRHVVLDGRNLKEAFRRRLIEFIREMQVEVEYLVFESTLAPLLERDAEREEPEGKDTILDQYNRMDLVHPWEAHRIQYILQ